MEDLEVWDHLYERKQPTIGRSREVPGIRVFMQVRLARELPSWILYGEAVGVRDDGCLCCPTLGSLPTWAVVELQVGR